MKRGHLSKPDDWKMYPKSLLEKGIKVELEHTTSKKVARRIETDHLAEFGIRYYPELDKMEAKLAKELKKNKPKGMPMREYIKRQVKALEKKQLHKVS